MQVDFGEKLRRLRESREFTQSALAKTVHMTQRKISYLECGKYEPGLSDLVTLCCFFKVSADDLLGLPRFKT